MSATRATTSEILSVTAYAAQIERAVLTVGTAIVEGEAQSVSLRPNGMMWFTLTDGRSKLACKVFAADLRSAQHQPKDGQLIQVRVQRPDLWKDAGQLSLIVTNIRLAGDGELLARRRDLIARLVADGLCDPARRPALPAFATTVGVIGSPGSDGMSDVVRALQDRWPATNIVTCGSLVQGKAAPAQLIDALATLCQQPDVQVIIMARGGGSVQDLACFDDEGLCRALFACPVPVIVAVGHTDNIPVANHVTWSAATPSRSAELAVPDPATVTQTIRSCDEILSRVAEAKIDRAGSQLDQLAVLVDSAQRRVLTFREEVASCAEMIATQTELTRLNDTIRQTGDRLSGSVRRQRDEHDRDWRRAFERLRGEMSAGARRALQDGVDRTKQLGELLAARDFRRAGWLLASYEDRPVVSIQDLSPGREITLHLSDGRATARVQTTNRSADHG